MKRALLLAAFTAGCPLFGDDDDSSTSGYAPRIDASSPGAALVTVPADGDASFSARGVDDDSLELDWSWQLDGDWLGGGDSVDGTFDAALLLSWSAGAAGTSAELAFVVSDGALSAERLWAVDFE